MEFHKACCLRWIGPYFSGSDPASRERTALDQANHESNIKVVVLGDDPAPLEANAKLAACFLQVFENLRANQAKLIKGRD